MEQRSSIFQTTKIKHFLLRLSLNEDYTLVKLNESEWDKTLFSTSGIVTEEKGVKAFVYTDRGVYRPGDTVYVSLIARNGKESLPNEHPITAKVKTPLGSDFKEIKINSGKDGFYSFNFHTDLNSPTGSWQIILDIGSKKVYQNVSIETILPNKFRIGLKTDPESIIDKKT
jgi:alpha-2-macroglobulin